MTINIHEIKTDICYLCKTKGYETKAKFDINDDFTGISLQLCETHLLNLADVLPKFVDFFLKSKEEELK